MIAQNTHLLKRNLPLAQEYLAFLLLNLFDLFLTGWIFKHQGQEANGIAAWVLKWGHLQGFALYKFLMVVVVILICEAIGTYRPNIAKILILSASALYVAVVFWECYLIYLFIDHPMPVIKDGTVALQMIAGPVFSTVASTLGHYVSGAAAFLSGAACLSGGWVRG